MEGAGLRYVAIEVGHGPIADGVHRVPEVLPQRLAQRAAALGYDGDQDLALEPLAQEIRAGTPDTGEGAGEILEVPERDDAVERRLQ